MTVQTVIIIYIAVSFCYLVFGMMFDAHKKTPVSHTVWSLLWALRLMIIFGYILDSFLYSIDMGKNIEEETDNDVL